MDFKDKIYDRLSNDTINKLKKAMYRAVDLIEMFFPDPDDYSKRVVLDQYQKDFIDCIQFGFPLSQLRFSEVKTPPSGVITIWRRQVGKSWCCGYANGALAIIGPESTGKPPCYQGIVAASEEEAGYLIEKVKICFEESDFNDFVVGKPRVDRIKLANKSLTRSHTCSHKCCTKDTLIQLYDGSLTDFEHYSKEKIVTYKDNKLKESKNCIPFRNGIKECVEITTRSGRKIKCTKNHPFLTQNGYIEAKDLKSFHRLSMVRRLPDIGNKLITDEEIKFLAYMIAEGSLGNYKDRRYKNSYNCHRLFTNTEKEIMEDFLSTLKDFTFINDHTVYVKDKNMQGLLISTKLQGCKSGDKFVPKIVFQSTTEQIALFLSKLIDCDGCVDDKHIRYTSKSLRLIKDLSLLFTRIGMFGAIRSNYNKKYKKNYYQLSFSSPIDFENATKYLKLCCRKQKILNSVVKSGKTTTDTFPLWNDIFTYLKEKGFKKKVLFDRCGIRVNTKRSLSYEKIKRIVDNFEGFVCNFDIFWDYIKEIKDIGLQETIGIEVPITHNHITNGFVTHNSIRGPKYHIIYIDESAQMDEGILFSAALPTVEHGDRWVAITTPQGNKGKLIEFYDKGLKTRPLICTKCGAEYSQNSFQIDFPLRGKYWKIPENMTSCPSCGQMSWKFGVGLIATPYLDPWNCRIIDPVKLKQTLDMFGWSPWARQEYIGEILDEASMVILKEWIDKNTNNKLRNKMVYNPQNKYVIGMDYGRLHDASSFAVTHLNRKTGRIILDYMRTVSGEFDYETDYQGIYNHVGEIFKFYKPYLAVVDATGIGYSQVERIEKDLRMEWGLRTKLFTNVKGSKNRPRLGFNINKQTKPELIGNMINLLSMNPHQLELPPQTEPEIKDLVIELLRFECEIMEAGYIKYGTQNYHDDRVIAYALSLYGHKKKGYSSVKPRGFQYKTIKKKRRDRNRYFRPKIRMIKEVIL